MTFTIQKVATSGHEILNKEGQVVAWAIDEVWATLIAAALSQVGECRAVERAGES